VGELGDVLLLMRGARDSFRTLKATLRQWEDYDRSRLAAERYAATPEGQAEGLHEQVDGEEAAPSPGRLENVLRLWLERPDRLREERQRSDGALEIGVLHGQRWWRYDPEWGLDSNEDEPAVGSGIGDSTRHLLDPAPLLAELSLEPAGRTRLAGRPAIRLRARRRRSGFSFGLIHLDREAEEYEFLIDAERGIVLREAALFEGEEYHVREMLEVVFDDEISPQTFVLEAPPVGDVKRPRGARRVTWTSRMQPGWRHSPFSYPA
jgi:outer membrane lipoprotein-sorting protein